MRNLFRRNTQGPARNAKQTLHYLSGSKIPSTSANSIQVMRMCEAFACLDFDVTLVARNPGILLAPDEIPKFYGLQKTFSLLYTTKRFPDLFGIIHTLKSVFSALNSNATIIYGRHIPSCILAGSFSKNVALELHEANAINKWWTRKIFQMSIQRKWITHLVVISDALRKDVETVISGAPVKILVAHDGARNSQKKERHTGGLKPIKGRLAVGYIGHLYEGRGIEIILAASKALPNIDFHLVGGDDHAVQSVKLAAGNSENIFLHGFVSPAEAADFLVFCDIAIAPYQTSVMVAGRGPDTSKWMSPLKLFEYMSAGKPIVCSDLPVIKEILVNEKTALLVAPKDVPGWVHGLSVLATDESLRERLGSAARNESEKYCWDARAKTVLRFLGADCVP